MIDFIHMSSPQLLRDYYWLVEEACANFNRHGNNEFAPDVYSVLTRGQAEMFVGRDNGIPKGFFTCYTVQHPNQSPVLHIWHGYIQPGGSRAYLQAAFDYMNGLAKERGCSSFAFTTARKGWDRVIGRSKFRFVSTTFEREVV